VRRTLGALLASAAAVLAAAPAALATTQTASAGGVTATLTFTGTLPNVTSMQLQIANAGQSLYDQPVTSSECGKYCSPLLAGAKQSSVQVLDLTGDGTENVVLSLYTGGANCCAIDQVFSLDPGTMTYQPTTHDFAYAGAAIKDLGHNGRYEFETADGYFKYEFTDGADSGQPVEILSFAGGTFTDVTRRYPRVIQADANLWLKAFKHDLSNGVGLIAAWAADEDELGHVKQVNAYLQQQLKAGHLNSSLAPVEPGGAKFIRALQKFLRKRGYLH
jgi:hypothetical protein